MAAGVQPTIPMCKLAEYTVTASSTRRRSLVKSQIVQALDESDKRRWWHTEARGEIRKFFHKKSASRDDLLIAANRLRDEAAAPGMKDSKQATLLGSARAIESFAPIAELVRDEQVVASAGRRESARIQRGNIQIVVSPDLLFLQRGTEAVVGALKLHASQEYRLEREALINAAAILYTYLDENSDKPDRAHCVVADIFTPAFETAPARLHRRMQAVEAACEEIEGWWAAMFDRVYEELEAKRHRRQGQ